MISLKSPKSPLSCCFFLNSIRRSRRSFLLMPDLIRSLMVLQNASLKNFAASLVNTWKPMKFPISGKKNTQTNSNPRHVLKVKIFLPASRNSASGLFKLLTFNP